MPTEPATFAISVRRAAHLVLSAMLRRARVDGLCSREAPRSCSAHVKHFSDEDFHLGSSLVCCRAEFLVVLVKVLALRFYVNFVG